MRKVARKDGCTALAFVAAALTALILSSGCGTIWAHSGDIESVSPGPYGGVRQDAHWIGQFNEECAAHPWKIALVFPYYPFLIADMALSAVCDTVLLPWTLK